MNRTKNYFETKGYIPSNKLHNCRWIFTIGDVDDHPSVPHAHSKEEGYRLNAWSGEIFPPGNERKASIGRLNRKELARLHNDKRFIAFAIKQVSWYRRTYPNIHFYVPEWFELKYLRIMDGAFEEVEDMDSVYIFVSGSIKLMTDKMR